MPYHIRNASSETYFTTTAWPKLLQVAISYGWEPTNLWFDLPTERTEGNSLYPAETSQPQNHVFQSSIVVAAEEARRLTRALERALPDLPDHKEPPLQRGLQGGRGFGRGSVRLFPILLFSTSA